MSGGVSTRSSKVELSDEDLKKITTSVAETLKQMNLGAKRSEYSESASIKHTIPVLKADDISEYLAWNDAMKGVCLGSGCGDALDEKIMENVLTIVGKHENLQNLDPDDANDAALLSAIRQNDRVMGYLNMGLTIIEHRVCVSATKTSDWPLGIAYKALREVREHFIPSGTMTKATLKKTLRGVTMKSRDPKDLGNELIKVKTLYLEAGYAVDESDLVDQAMLVLPGAYADAMIGVHKTCDKPGNPTLKEIIEAARDKYQFAMKDKEPVKDEKKEELTLTEVDDVKKKGSIKGKCYTCGIAGHREMNCWEREENANKRPENWVSRMKKDGKEVSGVTLIL